jgi:Ca2+-binding EF-hand superfamily protein
MVLFFVVLVFFGLLLQQLLVAVYFAGDDQPLEERQELYIFFGTFSRATFSMFELTFANWPPIARLLSERVSQWFMLFMMIYKMTLGFCLVGVVNGVFMQETLNVASLDDHIMLRKRSAAVNMLNEKMRRLFKSADTSEDGMLNREEVKGILEDKEVQKWMSGMEINVFVEDSERLFDLLDEDGSGELTLMELIKGVTKLRGNARSLDIQYMMNKVEHVEKICKQLEDRHFPRDQSLYVV